MAFDIDPDYVDVAARIAEFKAKYPDGSLQSWRDPYIVVAAEQTFVVYAAAAFRTPDDECPGIGWAWEPVPGKTPFTKMSELQNAETAAWGRAIVALGFETKHVASANEIWNRRAEQEAAAPRGNQAPAANGAARPASASAPKGPSTHAPAAMPEWRTALREGLEDANLTYGHLSPVFGEKVTADNLEKLVRAYLAVPDHSIPSLVEDAVAAAMAGARA